MNTVLPASPDLSHLKSETERLKRWLKWAYEGTPRERKLALRMLREEPELLSRSVWVACAAGHEDALRKMLNHGEGSANRPGGPLGMPPLVAVTHSLLILEPECERDLLESAGLLLEHGADVNSS